MSYQTHEEPYTSYPRAPGSSGGPDRLNSSHGSYSKNPHSPYNEMPAPGSSHGYPAQAPITPVTSNTYPPPPPPSSGYYGLASNPSDHMPSPPPSSHGGGRQVEHSVTFTPEGAPIVPVGVSGGKMFRCKGFGDCDKVFTRSEHLARHVRKHTGERPFPCHCGKAFSRLDNLRQHAATVHADHMALNEAMLSSLNTVHVNLSMKAGREQRKRGEIVEVPKNAVERPRHNEYRGGRGGDPPPSQQTNEFGEFQPGWEERPRTGYAQPYPYPDQHAVDNGGPSRRPPSSSGYPYQYGNYDQNRPPTAGAPSDAGPPVPYPYRPMSASGRELPVPQHYAESEPPVSAHGPPPQSPMYPPGPQGQWSSSPTHSNAYPHHEGAYPPHPPADNYYEHQTPAPHYAAAPGSSGPAYAYPPPPSGYYPPGAPGAGAPPVQAPGQGPYPQYPYPGNPSDSPFQYSAPDQQSQYPYGNYDRKRRAEDENEDSRKMPRPASAVPQNLNDAIRETGPNGNGNSNGNGNGNNASEPLWLPPTTERRSSLAISALLGSPRQAPRSGLDDLGVPSLPSAPQGATYPPQPYPYHPSSQEQGHTAESSAAATPKEETKTEA